jgi:acyl-CoA thioester hydrolase
VVGHASRRCLGIARSEFKLGIGLDGKLGRLRRAFFRLRFDVHPAYEMIVAVLPGDIDEQDHVNNAVYLRWIQDAATAHRRSLASPEAQRTVGWVVLRHEIDYKIPACLGDEIALRTWVGAASRLKFERFTEARRKIDNQLLCKARTVWVPVDRQTGKPARVSAEVRARFSV